MTIKEALNAYYGAKSMDFPYVLGYHKDNEVKKELGISHMYPSLRQYYVVYDFLSFEFIGVYREYIQAYYNAYQYHKHTDGECDIDILVKPEIGSSLLQILDKEWTPDDYNLP